MFETCYYLCDELAIVMAMIPETIRNTLIRRIHIVEDGYAKGAMIVNWFGKMEDQETSEVAIIT